MNATPSRSPADATTNAFVVASLLRAQAASNLSLRLRSARSPSWKRRAWPANSPGQVKKTMFPPTSPRPIRWVDRSFSG
jgi:hypothetical protein